MQIALFMVHEMLKYRKRTDKFRKVLLMLLVAGAPVMAQDAQEPDRVTDRNVPSSYLIGPGDVLQVFVWRNPELSVTIPVRPDGRITTPLVEEMLASGKTAALLARNMEAVLGEYIRSPKVNIIVTNPQSLMSVVKAIGQVAVPQGVPFRDGMTALDLILAVGGMTEFAAGNRAKVIRKVDGKTTEIRLRLGDLINKGDLSRDIALLPGDVVVVPESLF